MQVKSPDKVMAARVKTLAKLIQGNGANKAILHSSGMQASSQHAMSLRSRFTNVIISTKAHILYQKNRPAFWLEWLKVVLCRTH